MAETEKTAAMLLDDLAAWICRSAARWPRAALGGREFRRRARRSKHRPHAATAGPHTRSVLMGVVGEIAPLGLENYGSQALQWRTTPLVMISFDFRRGLRIRCVEPRPVLAAVPVVDDYRDL